ncbi:unnamed protein product [Rhizophagus irregularis]|uniref:Nucleoside phosphorylase domain-containing protein n=2 Tax=Rhizophagus irregularis TaxID=588596 RepID=A0A915ZXG5_9GLOM|nr:unnamed protein product [Rhizophagus irregularis]CAB5194083.1 unnamed protein product [Rhizophagus irregularis]CAB5394859.1 unnamed protein product [Rhizophagus irregularis]
MSNLINYSNGEMKTSTFEEKMENANFPMSDKGRVYHVEVKRGEVANRIITVGDHTRAEEFAQYLDKDSPLFRLSSARGFLTITGKYKGVPISIIAIGMGLPMMDFFVREVRSVVDGQLAIIRFGTCGSIGAARTGSIIVQNAAFAITRNYNYFSDTEEIESELSDEKPYNFTKIFHADPQLYKKIELELINSFGEDNVFTGLNATCDSFYSSQGRKDGNFRDYNSNLISTISDVYPEAISLEMEAFMLFHLAKSSTSLPLKDSNNTILKNSIKAASAAMVVADRVTNDFISPVKVHDIQKVAGKAVLNALVDFELIYVHPDDDDCVWNQN